MQLPRKNYENREIFLSASVFLSKVILPRSPPSCPNYGGHFECLWIENQLILVKFALATIPICKLITEYIGNFIRNQDVKFGIWGLQGSRLPTIFVPHRFLGSLSE